MSLSAAQRVAARFLDKTADEHTDAEKATAAARKVTDKALRSRKSVDYDTAGAAHSEAEKAWMGLDDNRADYHGSMAADFWTKAEKARKKEQPPTATRMKAAEVAADDTYAQRAKEAHKLLAEIARKLDKHAKEAKEAPGDWSHAGDLGHVVSELQTLSDFLGR